MDQLLYHCHELAKIMYSKLNALLKHTASMNVRLTGLMGIAAVLAGIYLLRRKGRGAQRPDRPQRDASVASKPSTEANSTPIPLSELRAQLPGIKTITISVPGVLLEEWDPQKLEKSATVKPQAAEIVKELCVGMHVYLIAHVESDDGESLVRDALKSAKVLGPGVRQLPPHRLVFCEKLKGKVSLVRQIEPQMHIDGVAETVEDLHRFIPHLYHVVRKGTMVASCNRGLVSSGPTLEETLNVQI